MNSKPSLRIMCVFVHTSRNYTNTWIVGKSSVSKQNNVKINGVCSMFYDFILNEVIWN